MLDSSTVTTSKTSSLKALLLKAWRERWSDLQWGIHIKTILPRGVSGDVYNLADCILQQALIGPGPNYLVLSYLRHSLSSQLVSYGAVLLGISKYQGFHKPHCIVSLLQLLERIQKNVSCRGKPEECMLLSTALLSLAHWLLTCSHQALVKLAELRTSPEHTTIFEKPLTILTEMYQCDFTHAMLHLARHEDRDTRGDMLQKCSELESALTPAGVSPAARKQAEDALALVRSQEQPGLGRPRNAVPPEALAYSINAMVMFEALLRPTNSVESFINQLLMVQTLKGYSTPELYCELIRICLIGLIDSNVSSEEMRWDGFTFLKVIQLLTALSHRQTSIDSESLDVSADILAAFEMLLQYAPVLNLADVKSNCNCMEFLLNGLIKAELLTEAQAKTLLAKRELQGPPRLEQGTASNACLILRAEPTVSSILKTLDADYTKNQEALLGVLCQMMSGKSFELILTAAAATGKVQTFAQKLVKFNECSKQVPGENTKASQQRATLFDISFLMLCHITQTYGTRVALSDESSGESFFELWVREFMVQPGEPKSPEMMVQQSDPAKVDLLLSQFNSTKEGDFKTSLVKWHEVCMHVPSVIKEVLIAWEHGSLSTTEVKRILDNIRSRMSCLSVCATAWLCSYIQVLPQDNLLKPMNMIQHFLTQPTDESQLQPQDNFKERSSLMLQIIRKMCYDLPPGNTKKAIALSHSITSSQPINDLLQTVWLEVHQRGWLDVSAMHSLESLFVIGGAQWFVTTLIKEALSFPYQEDLSKAVELVFSIFHLDIQKCALALLLHTLPQYLYNQGRAEDMTEPKGQMLAHLSVCTIYAALQHAGSSVRCGKPLKRTRRDADIEDAYGLLDGAGPIKMRRLSVHTADATEDLALCGLVPPTSSGSHPDAEDTLARAVAGLFRAFQGVAESSRFNQHTLFVFCFLEESVRCGGDKVGTLLQFMPLPLVPSLIKLLPEMFNTGMILRLYDLNTSVGRKSAARSLCMLHLLQRPKPTR